MNASHKMLLAAGGGLASIALFSCCGGCVMLLATRSDPPRSIVSNDLRGELGIELISEKQDEPAHTELRRPVPQQDLEIQEKVRAAAASGKTELRATSMASGNVGVFKEPVKVLQVLKSGKEGEFLANVGFEVIGRRGTSALVWFAGVDTTDLVDDRYWPPEGMEALATQWFHVEGPVTYEAGLSTRTVMKVRRIAGPSTDSPPW